MSFFLTPSNPSSFSTAAADTLESTTSFDAGARPGARLLVPSASPLEALYVVVLVEHVKDAACPPDFGDVRFVMKNWLLEDLEAPLEYPVQAPDIFVGGLESFALQNRRIRTCVFNGTDQYPCGTPRRR